MPPTGQSPAESYSVQPRSMRPAPSMLRAVVPAQIPPRSCSRLGLDSGALHAGKGNGVKGAIFGALLLGTAAAVVGSQLCAEGEDTVPVRR